LSFEEIVTVGATLAPGLLLEVECTAFAPHS
jgi:hypothetical protein